MVSVATAMEDGDDKNTARLKLIMESQAASNQLLVVISQHLRLKKEPRPSDILYLLFLPLVILGDAWIISKIWHWHIEPMLGLTPTLAMFAGSILIIRIALISSRKPKDSTFAVDLFARFIFWATMLGTAWLFTLNVSFN